MTLEEAKELLDQCTRAELRDHAFGDREIYFTKDGTSVAEGYSGTECEITIFGTGDGGLDDTYFQGSEAYELLRCGTLDSVERNDSTGPDEYQEGECMPGLTTAGVLDELTKSL